MAIEEKGIWDLLKQVVDPEIGLDLVNLGLIYSVNVVADDSVDIKMTLTTRGCPLHASLTGQIADIVKKAGIDNVNVELVWDPPWNPDMITEEGKKFLGYQTQQ